MTPDPQTAPVVQRIFRDFLNGNGIFAIAEALTRTCGIGVAEAAIALAYSRAVTLLSTPLSREP